MSQSPGAGYAADPPPQGGSADLKQIGRALWRNGFLIFFLASFAFGASAIFVNLATPRYAGEAKLLLESRDSFFTRPGQDRGDAIALIDEQAVASQVQVAMSRDLAREAIGRLNLVGNEEFDPMVRGLGLSQRLMVLFGVSRNPMERAPEDRILEAYYDRLAVYNVGKSRILAVEFRSKDPDLAAKGANTVAELYLDFQERAKKDTARNASTWLGSNIDGLRTRVAEAEAKVEAFRSRTGLLMGSGTTTITSQQLTDINTQLSAARTAGADARAKADLIRDLIKNGRTFEIPDVANNELIRRLIEQRIQLRAQLALESRTLLPEHPRIKELNAQLADMEAQVRAAAERTVRTLENDARIAAARVESFQAALEQQKGVAAKANADEVELRALEREARSQREQLESYLARYREAVARDAENATPADARIVSRAMTPQTPTFPKKVPTILIVTIATLVLTIGAIVAGELFRSGPRPAPTEARLPETRAAEADEADAPVGPSAPPTPDLAAAFTEALRLRGSLDDAPAPEPSVPSSAPSSPAVPSPVVPSPALPSPALPSLALDGLVERLERIAPDGRGRRILLTGTAAPQAVRTIGLDLGRVLAARGTVILVEASGPSAGRLGLTDLVAGEAAFLDVIQPDAGGRLHRVGPGLLDPRLIVDETRALDITLSAFDRTYAWVLCLVAEPEAADRLAALGARADAAVIASDDDPASPRLVTLYEALKEAGAGDVVVARGALGGDLSRAA